MRTLACSGTVVLVLAVLTVAAEQGPRTGGQPAAMPPRWSPPPCGDATHRCIDLEVQSTGKHQNIMLDDAADYRIHLPKDRPLVGGFDLRGGRNVTIIGGQIDLPRAPTRHGCDDSRPCRGIGIYKRGSSGPNAVYIEGVFIRNPYPRKNTSDGISLDTRPSNPTTLTVQNVRVQGIVGCDPSNPSAHADVLQPYNAPRAHIRVHGLTGTTACQGLQVAPDLARSLARTTQAKQLFENVNLRVIRNPWTGLRRRYVVWLTSGPAGGCVSAPTTFRNVYVDEPGRGLQKSTWPSLRGPRRCRAQWHARSRTLSFPRLPSVHGVIRDGRPPRGDFVPRGVAGTGYVSPGLPAVG